MSIKNDYVSKTIIVPSDFKNIFKGDPKIIFNGKILETMPPRITVQYLKSDEQYVIQKIAELYIVPDKNIKESMSVTVGSAENPFKDNKEIFFDGEFMESDPLEIIIEFYAKDKERVRQLVKKHYLKWTRKTLEKLDDIVYELDSCCPDYSDLTIEERSTLEQQMETRVTRLAEIKSCLFD